MGWISLSSAAGRRFNPLLQDYGESPLIWWCLRHMQALPSCQGLGTTGCPLRHPESFHTSMAQLSPPGLRAQAHISRRFTSKGLDLPLRGQAAARGSHTGSQLQPRVHRAQHPRGKGRREGETSSSPQPHFRAGWMLPGQRETPHRPHRGTQPSLCRMGRRAQGRAQVGDPPGTVTPGLSHRAGCGGFSSSPAGTDPAAEPSAPPPRRFLRAAI